MKNEMLINVSQPEECRIAIVEDGVLEELYIERSSQDNYVGNVYKGVVVNLEPTIQAAFVDFGVGRNGFLHISDVEPQYYRQAGIDPAKYMEMGGGSHRDSETVDDIDHSVVGNGDDDSTAGNGSDNTVELSENASGNPRTNAPLANSESLVTTGSAATR